MTFTAELIAKAAKGDRFAQEDLYNETYSSVYHSVNALIKDEDAVLDIVQDTYVKAFQSLGQLDAPENFRAWAKRIAANKAKDYLKRKKPVLFTDLADEDGNLPEFRDEVMGHQPEAVLDAKETKRLMEEILGSLSEEQRMAIVLYHYEEMSVREIAQMLGCSENTVKSRLSYGRKKLDAKVRELEKQGTKLYSLSPLPFLLWLLRGNEKTAMQPPKAMFDSIAVQSAASAAAGAGAAAAKAVALKIAAGVLAVAVAGGTVAAVLGSRNKPAEEPPAVIAEHPAREEAAPPQEMPEIIAEEAEIHGEGAEAVTEEAAAEPAEEPAEEMAEETAEEAPDTAAAAEEAFTAVMEAYTAACADTTSDWLGDTAGSAAQYGELATDAMLFYHLGGGTMPFFSARVDLDGNGVEELLIGSGADAASASAVAVYAFDGSDAVLLCDTLFELLQDGTFLLVGNGGGVAEVKRLAADGFTLEAAESAIALGAMPTEADYAAHGGKVLAQWEYLCG